MSALRRYEILLPLQFNDGQPIPDGLIGDALVELRQRFGAVTWETQIIRGAWEHEGRVYHDDLMRVAIDVSDSDNNRLFFRDLKERLKIRFRQIDLWMTTHTIETV